MTTLAYQILAADAGVAALVGTRIYPYGIIPQEVVTFPVITYQTITGTTDNVQGSTSPSDYERVQVDCWSIVSGAEADSIFAAVRAAFDNLTAVATYKCGVVMSTFNGHDYEPTTRRFKSSSDWDFYILR